MQPISVPTKEGVCKSAVLTFTDSVAVEPHGDSAIGIAGMNKVLREVKVVLDQFREGVVCLLVGKVGSPVDECLQLLLIDIVDKDGRVMALYHQLKAIAASSDVGLHSVPYQYILKLRTEVKAAWVGVFSY